jgi:pimeloyl-ACP methyl ester carboxylesterase
VFSLALVTCGGGASDDAGTGANADAETAPDGSHDAGTDSGTDGGTPPVFSYDSCADPGRVLQFPTPAWETKSESESGVVYAIPEGDAVGRLVKQVRPSWHQTFSGIDGAPLNAAWFVALDGKADSVDVSRAMLFRASSGNVAELPAALAASLSESGSVLMLKSSRPLPTPEKGERYILALFDGIAAGAKPIPACGADGEFMSEYMDAAAALISAGKASSGLVLALPFAPSRMSVELPALFEAISENPVLAVESVGAVGLDSFAEFNPDDETKAVLAPQAYRGILNTPLYQADTDGLGAFVVDHANDNPLEQGRTKPGFVLALPAAGTAPYPVILWQHGGGHNKEALFLVAKPYAEAGFALIGIDLPYHGDRSKVPGKNGTDQDMADFEQPIKTRDNFRQAAADHMAVITGLAALNPALKPLTGLDQTLDPEAVFFMGHSMGSLSGTITSGVASPLLGTNLIAGGAPYRQLVAEGLFTLYIQDILHDRPRVETEVLLAFAQTMLDGGDPLNYPSRFEDAAVRPMDALVWESIGDPAVNNPATDMQALEFGAQLARPPHHAVAGMAETDLPVFGNYSAPGGSATRLLFHRVYDPVTGPQLHMEPLLEKYVHETAAACFSGRLTAGACTVEP